MKIKKIRKVVLSESKLIYAKNVGEIERKVKILNRRAVAKRDPKKANKLRNKAEEWEALLRADFWKVRNNVSNKPVS